MTNRQKAFRLSLLVSGLLYLPQAPAYLDPVTGSMLIQGLIGAIAGAAVAVKLYWRRWKTWFERVTGKPGKADGADDEAEAVSSPSAEKE